MVMIIMLIIIIVLLKVFNLKDAFGFFILRFLSSSVDYEKMERKKYVPATTDWSHLPKDLLEVVVKRLDRLPDHCRFGGVCKSWRSVAIENRRHLPNQLPLLMVSEGNNNETRRFLRLSHKSNSFFQPFRECYLQEAEQQQQQLHIPHGHVCRGSDYGWLFLIDEYNFDTKLLNPFTAAEIPLPSATTLQPKRKYSKPLNKWASYAGLLGVLKVVFSSNPSFQPTPLVLIICNVGCTTTIGCTPSSTTTIGIGCTCTPSRLAFCRPGDKAWTCLHSPSPSPYENNPSWKHIYCHDAIYYKDQFYVLLHSGHILAYDIGRWHHTDDDSSMIKVTKIASAPKGFIPYYYGHMYLVEVEGQLVIVSRKIKLFRTQPNQAPCSDFYSIYDGTVATSTTALAVVYSEDDNDGDGDDDWDREDIEEKDVECLVVNSRDHFVHKTIGFDLLRFDEASGGGGQKEWVKVKNLGDNALFLGNNTSFACPSTAFSSSNACIPAANCIFFTDGRGERTILEQVRHHDLGIYKLKNGSIKNLSCTVSSSFERLGVPLPIWVTFFPW